VIVNQQIVRLIRLIFQATERITGKRNSLTMIPFAVNSLYLLNLWLIGVNRFIPKTENTSPVRSWQSRMNKDGRISDVGECEIRIKNRKKTSEIFVLIKGAVMRLTC